MAQCVTGSPKRSSLNKTSILANPVYNWSVCGPCVCGNIGRNAHFSRLSIYWWLLKPTDPILFTAKPRARAAPPTGDPILFDDTSSGPPAMNSQGYYTPGYNMGGPTNDMQGGPGMTNLFADPMTNAAMMYGSSLANQGKDMVNKEVWKRTASPAAALEACAGCVPNDLSRL